MSLRFFTGLSLFGCCCGLLSFAPCGLFAAAPSGNSAPSAPLSASVLPGDSPPVFAAVESSGAFRAGSDRRPIAVTEVSFDPRAGLDPFLSGLDRLHEAMGLESAGVESRLPPAPAPYSAPGDKADRAQFVAGGGPIPAALIGGDHTRLCAGSRSGPSVPRPMERGLRLLPGGTTALHSCATPATFGGVRDYFSMRNGYVREGFFAEPFPPRADRPPFFFAIHVFTDFRFEFPAFDASRRDSHVFFA